MNRDRLDRLTAAILANGLDGVALMPGPNMVYFTGIHCHVSERPIVAFIPADDEPAIIIPTLEAMKAEAAGIAPDRIFSWNDREGYVGAFQQACSHLELADYLLGVEALHMRVLELQMLQRFAPGLQLAHAEPVISPIRQVKDEAEIEAMEKAVAVAEKAMQHLLPRIRAGLTEKQVASMLMQEMLVSGAQSLSFSPIVATGPNGASPHAQASSRLLQNGDLLVVDWGAYVDDYPSDLTRTFAIGSVEDELAHIHDVVRQANAAARARVAPGVTGQEVDSAARQVIEEAGYGEYFIHRTGHGIGLEVHEPPDMSQVNGLALIEGNTFTIEPGIYLPGRGGVRIEDNIVVTADGGRSLSSFPRELMNLGA